MAYQGRRGRRAAPPDVIEIRRDRLRHARTGGRARVVGDWCKRLGMFFVALAWQRYSAVTAARVPSEGEIAVLVALSVVATALLVAGLVIDVLREGSE